MPAGRRRSVAALLLALIPRADGFARPPHAARVPRIAPPPRRPTCTPRARTRNSAPLMFYQGGFFNVGSPEILIIAACGYFLLGPEELFRLSKEIGKLVGQAKEYVTKASAEWTETLDGENFEFKEVKEIQAAAQELQEAFNFRSARYNNDLGNFNSDEEETTFKGPNDYANVDERANADQLDVDGWNDKILADEAAAVGPALASQMTTAPPATSKAARLAEVERLYEAKRRALELEFGYEREKLAIELEEEPVPAAPAAVFSDVGATAEDWRSACDSDGVASFYDYGVRLGA
jgi:Sec-independent protein translocase protein TatA